MLTATGIGEHPGHPDVLILGSSDRAVLGDEAIDLLPAPGDGHGVATRMANQFFTGLDELRYEPTAKRVRAVLGCEVALDSTRALLVWEPRRVVPQYAVPLGDMVVELVPAGSPAPATDADPVRLGAGGPLVLTPDNSFGAHTCGGEILTVRLANEERPGAAFEPADPDLAGYVFLDFAAFDGWFEEEEPVVSHPHDPFTRIDVRRSARHVRIELDGHVLADSRRPSLLFETYLPVRYYLPRDDVDMNLLRPTDTSTTCSYKGTASYWSLELPEKAVDDVAWSYPRPLSDAAEVVDMLCFFNERVDVVIDGVRQERPQSPWS